MDPVSAVDVALCSFELPHPVRFGKQEVRKRDYVALRARTAAGQEVGYGAGYTRGTPLFAGTRLLAPHLVGADPLARRSFTRQLAASHRTGYAGLARAASLLDLALWDLAAQQAQLPLWRLLGGGRRAVPAMVVCGYFIDRRGEDAIVADLVRYESEGFRALKLMLDARPPAAMRSFLERAKGALSSETELAVDLHYAPAGLPEARRLLEALDDLGLAFFEDPLEPTQWRNLVALRQRLRTPIAAGEDVVSPFQFHDLLEAASVLRVDPTTCGGFADAITGIELAASLGVPVIPHGPAGIGAQLAAAFETVGAVEVIPTSGSADGFDAFVQLPFELHDGHLHLDDAPGAGLRLDWDGLAEVAVATWSTEVDG